MWKRIFNFLKNHLSATISILSIIIYHIFSSHFLKLNVFDFSASDFQSISIALLVFFLEIILKYLRTLINNKLTKINVLFKNTENRNYNIDSDCHVHFDNLMMTQFFINIEVIGNPEILKNTQIEILFPSEFQVQLQNDNDSVYEENYLLTKNLSGIKINVKNLFNNDKKSRIRENKTIKVYLMKEALNYDSTVEVSTDNKQILLESNNLIL